MLVVWAAVGAAPQVRAEPELLDGIRAVVHEGVVTIYDVDSMTSRAEELLSRQYRRSQPEMYFKKLSAARNDSLDQLIERQLILQDFKITFSEPQRKAIIDKQVNKAVDQALEDEIRAGYGGNRMTFIQTLQAEGKTLERVRQTIRDRMIVNELRQKNISSELVVSPHRVEEYYLSHREEFKAQAEVKLRTIVLKCPGDNEVTKTEKLAEDILRALKEGATFAEMATIHSEGSQRNQGGDWGWQEASRLAKWLEDKALSLQAGQHSGVMSRSAGDDYTDYWVCEYDKGVATLGRHYVADRVLNKVTREEERHFEDAAASTNLPPPIEFYLLLVEDKRPERFQPLTNVRKQIEEALKTQEEKRLEKQWVDKLMKKTFVRVF